MEAIKQMIDWVVEHWQITAMLVAATLVVLGTRMNRQKLRGHWWDE